MMENERQASANGAADTVPAPLDTADDRTLMAEERTFSAWVRTGLTAIATGLAIAKILLDASPPWIVRLLGVLLTTVGGMAFGFGFWGYRRGTQHWSRATPRAVPMWLVLAFSSLLIAGAVLALVLILLD